MFGPLKTLFDRQCLRAQEDAELVSRLDPARTALLADLIADVKRPERLSRLGAPWLDAARFTSRVASACAWLDGIPAAPGKGWSGMPLYFFQAASDAEDAEAHRAMLALERGEPEILRRYTAVFARLPTAAQYLPTHTKVSWMLEGGHAAGTLHLRPLFSTFSSYGHDWVMDGDRRPHPIKGRLVAYRVPDFPKILGVSPTVATDFFVRVVIHDLCHAYLPDTPREAEGFHNAASLASMGTLPPPRYRDLWESFIHAECVDFSFCLRAEGEIAAMRKALGTPTPVQEDILEGYRKWYAHPNAVRNRKEAWGLPDGASAETLRSKIEEARADGFRINLRLMRDSRLMVDP